MRHQHHRLLRDLAVRLVRYHRSSPEVRCRQYLLYRPWLHQYHRYLLVLAVQHPLEDLAVLFRLEVLFLLLPDYQFEFAGQRFALVGPSPLYATFYCPLRHFCHFPCLYPFYFVQTLHWINLDRRSERWRISWK